MKRIKKYCEKCGLISSTPAYLGSKHKIYHCIRFELCASMDEFYRRDIPPNCVYALEIAVLENNEI